MKFFLILLLFFCIEIKADWVYVSNGVNIQYPNKFEIIGNRMMVGTGSNGIFLSENGTSWYQSSMNNTAVSSIKKFNNTVFTGTYGSIQGVFVSMDSGNSWLSNNLNNIKVACIEIFDNVIFVSAYLPSTGVYTSTNNGLNWIQNSLSFRSVYSFCKYNNNLFAGTGIYGIYKSVDNGNSWIQSSLNDKTILTIVQKGNLLFAGAAYEQGVFMSTDDGLTWVQTSLNNRQVDKLLVVSDIILAGTSFGGVYISYDNGLNWVQINSGLAGGLLVHDLIEYNSFVYSASNNGIYRRSISEITGLSYEVNNFSDLFSLSQNFPNPFNPVTNIRLSLPQSGTVKLSVYDITGREIGVLVNEKLSAGIYNYDWNAADYSSGIYFYRIVTDNFTDTKKMLLVK